jgi:hypothetical protein
MTSVQAEVARRFRERRTSVHVGLLGHLDDLADITLNARDLVAGSTIDLAAMAEVAGDVAECRRTMDGVYRRLNAGGRSSLLRPRG